MWLLRKFYGGQGGAIPPTDPRLLAMTEAQIEVEFEHIILDREERDAASGNKRYTDESYDEEEAEEERVDARLYIEEKTDFEVEEPIPLPKSEKDDDIEWVDDEIDDDELY